MKIYPITSKKRVERQRALRETDKTKIITLLGTSPIEAESVLTKFEIISYEIDREVYNLQRNSNCRSILIFGDILFHPVEEEAIYDLDFTRTIKNYSEYIKKFKDKDFLLTVSLRGMSKKKTIEYFMREAGHNEYKIKKVGAGFSLITPTRKYSFKSYAGGITGKGSPMAIITNL